MTHDAMFARQANLIRQHIHRFQQPEAFLPFDNPTFQNPPWEQAVYRVLIVRLSPFRDVDRSTPHLFLFQEVRRALQQIAQPGFIDMAFFPPRAERDRFSQNNIPYLLGTQSLRPASEFDLLLISNAYTLELINLPYLLLRSSFPLWASQRGSEWPILILGGSNALATQSIIRPNYDCLVDAIFFGEGEGLVGELVAGLAQNSPTAHKAALEGIATRIRGLWVAGTPSIEAPLVEKAVLYKPQAPFLLTEPPILNSAEAHTANLQINYGCPAFCAFCFEGYDRKPYRELALPGLLQTARQIKQAQGNEAINLYSFNFNTHSDIFDLLLELHRLFDRVSLKSQRADLLLHIDPLLEAEIEADKRSFTLGIEGISERQRAWLHKSLPTADINGLLRRLVSIGVHEIKLFYLLTGNEANQDIAEFRLFVQNLAVYCTAETHRTGRSARIIFSFGLLIRMPFTPLRHDRLRLEPESWRQIVGPAKSACETNGFEFRLAFDWPDYCANQVLALGGYWLAEPVVALAEKGYCFDTSLPEAYWQELQSWMKQAGHWNDAFLGEKGADYPFALEFVQTNVSNSFLYRQYQACQANQDEGYCLGHHCLGCDACLGQEQRQTLTYHRIRQPEHGLYLARLRQVMADKRRLKPVYLRLRMDDALAGASSEWREAYIFKGLLALYPDWVNNLLSVRESLFTVRPNDRAFPPMSGETIFALKAWNGEEIRNKGEGIRNKEEGFEVLGPVVGFVPGVFNRLRLDMALPLAHFAEPRKRLEAFLRGMYISYSLQRDGSRYCFDVPKAGQKKKVLFGGHFEDQGQTFEASLDIGPKFDLTAFLDSFGARGLYHYANISASSIE